MWQQLLVTIRWSGQTHWKNPLSKYFEALLEPVSNGLMLPFGAKDDFTHAPPLWCKPYLTKVLPGVKIQTPLIVPRKNAIKCTFGKMDVWDVGLKIATFLAVLFGCSAQQRLEMQHRKRVDSQKLIFPPGFFLALSYFTTLNKTMKKWLCAVQQGD